MKSTITLIRAVGTEFARRALRPIIIAGIIVAIVLLSICGWLTTQNAWWWILQAVLIGASLLFTAFVIAVTIVLQAVRPTLSEVQKPAVSDFVDKLQRVAENVQTPYPFMLFYVLRDVVRPRPDNFIEGISRDSKTLGPDLAKLRKLFESNSI